MTKDSLVNFAQMAVLTCQRAQGDQNKVMRESWEIRKDPIEPPRHLKDASENDLKWLRDIVADETLDMKLRVLGARILSCTFARKLGT